MGGGNGQKSKMARERNAEKNKGAKGTCIHPSLQSPRPDSPSLPVLPCSPSRLIPSISSPYLLAGSQLEANKKAMNIQVRTIPHPSCFSSPPLAPSDLSLYPTIPYPVPNPLVCHLFLSKFEGKARRGFPDSPRSVSGYTIWIRGQWPPTTRFSSIPLLLLLLLTQPDHALSPFYL